MIASFKRTDMIFFDLYFFFFNDTATTEIYTLSLHDALPISCPASPAPGGSAAGRRRSLRARRPGDRKSTRLNSSHMSISYAVFCLKKKKTQHNPFYMNNKKNVHK